MGAAVSRSLATVCAAAIAMAGIVTTASTAAGAPVKEHGDVRVDQVGYGTQEAKRAYVMSDVDLSQASFSVIGKSGKSAFTGTVGPNLGRWNATFPYVHELDFTAFRQSGEFRVQVNTGAVRPVSPAFRIGDSADLFGGLVGDVATFFQTQRDGADTVNGKLHRRPSHLTDAKATVYESAGLYSDDSMNHAPVAIPGAPTVDVAGGWFDAGDFLKFVETTSYALPMMMAAQSNLNRPDKTLAGEIDHGLSWLDKMWDGKSKTLYIQVGIGDGLEGVATGDHDVWRLPERDDALQVKPGDAGYFLKYRPVFRAAPPGEPISPNLAGRVAATFAMAAQAEAAHDEAKARQWLGKAADVLALAKTTSPGTLVTTVPHDYYGESSWRDDMTLGATELAVAGRMLGDARAGDWLRAAAGYAKDHIDAGGGGVLNLYETSSFADAELVKAVRAYGPIDGLRVSQAELLNHIKTKGLDPAFKRSNADPFRAAGNYSNYDVVSNTFGVAATARLYSSLSGDRGYDALATAARDWNLGANAWGLSFVIGAGSEFPRCPHHQVANLAGDGYKKILRGAVVNGPNSYNASREQNLDWYEGQANPCPADKIDRFEKYQAPSGTGNRNSRFVDFSGAWMTVEPANDFAASAILAFALAARS
ncbi:glycoside hydrolase family 9 protein [Planotetraspora sp. GP83]|uniref:glycoside hydrolase family 9 protein n=1 Tax=Planotetraspora sp. GP83 TaxID=3156264 RepID=UPI003515AC76